VRIPPGNWSLQPEAPGAVETATGSKYVTIEAPAVEGGGTGGQSGMCFPAAADGAGVAFSPDGRRLAMILRQGKGGQAPIVRVSAMIAVFSRKLNRIPVHASYDAFSAGNGSSASRSGALVIFGH
jgi:hypothetical protein